MALADNKIIIEDNDGVVVSEISLYDCEQDISDEYIALPIEDNNGNVLFMAATSDTSHTNASNMKYEVDGTEYTVLKVLHNM